MSDTTKRMEVDLLEITYTVSLRNLIFPVDLRDLLDGLARNGYELSRPPGPLPPRPAQIGFSGSIARKEDFVVSIDSASCVFQISGSSAEKILDAFKSLSEVILKETDVNINENLRYAGFIAHYKVDSGKSAPEQFAKFTQKNDKFLEFAKIVKKPVSIFSVRLCPLDTVPDDVNWFDISIEMDILQPRKYHIGMVYRNQRKEEVDLFLRDLTNNTTRLIEILERE